MAALEGGTRSHELAALYETRRSELAHSLTIDTPCRFWLRADGIDEMFKSLEVCGETLKAEILKVTLTAKVCRMQMYSLFHLALSLEAVVLCWTRCTLQSSSKPTSILKL